MRAKRTHNLSPEVVATVRRLVVEGHVASSQDALVESAVRLYERHLRDREEAGRWQKAALDPRLPGGAGTDPGPRHPVPRELGDGLERV
ncbi:MAG TPA: hypothetical protein VMU49_02615 [Candidatus Acidoferrales bacterium]|nr:hypothetical protein [Candidatus Acidoferrales bacterium]